jgi:hypothetical protein
MLHAAGTLTLVGEFRLFRELASSTLGSVLEQLDGEVGRVDEVLQVSASSTLWVPRTLFDACRELSASF